MEKATVIKIFAVILVVMAPIGFYTLVGPVEISIIQSWGRVTQDMTEIKTVIVVNNPTYISRWLKKVEFDLYINDFKIATEVYEESVEVKPLEKTEISLTSFLNNSKIPDLWVAYLSKGNVFEVRLAGNVTFGSMMREIICPISYKMATHTSLLDLLSNHESEYVRVGPRTLTLKSFTLTWGEVTSLQTQINGSAVVYNPNNHSIMITTTSYIIEINDIRLEKDFTPTPIALEPKVDTNISFTATLDNTMLDQWWHRHLGNDQVTRVFIKLLGVGEILGTKHSFVIAEAEVEASIRILGGTISFGYYIPVL